MATWVLVRGLAREAAHWGDFTGRFRSVEPGAHVVTVDLPGAGVLRDQRAATRVEDAVASCRAQLAAAGAPPPYRLFGLSLGGMVVSAWATAWPQEVSHCVVVNTSARSLGPMTQRLRWSTWPALLRLLLAAGPQTAEARILALTSNQPAVDAETLRAWVAIRHDRPMTFANMMRQLVCAARYRLPFPSPAARSLVLVSMKDRLVDPRCSLRLAELWQCASFVHPSAGHDLPLDDPGWVVQRVKEWLGPAGCERQ